MPFTVFTDTSANLLNRQIRDYAYDCAMEMAVQPGAGRGAPEGKKSEQDADSLGGDRGDGRTGCPHREGADQDPVEDRNN